MNEKFENEPVSRRRFLSDLSVRLGVSLTALVAGGTARLWGKRRPIKKDFPEGSIFTPSEKHRNQT